MHEEHSKDDAGNAPRQIDINSDFEGRTKKRRPKWYNSTLEDVWLEELSQPREEWPSRRTTRVGKQQE
jgi:hypothetical protein